jgi:hypothetical protein
VVVAGLSLLAPPAQLLYGQDEEKPVPDVKGTWTIKVTNLCHFDDVLDRSEPPLPPICTPDSEITTVVVITHQSGRVFAGYHSSMVDKLTGFIGPDGTLSVQYFSPASHEMERLFLQGALSTREGSDVVTGYAQGFSDLSIAPP